MILHNRCLENKEEEEKINENENETKKQIQNEEQWWSQILTWIWCLTEKKRKNIPIEMSSCEWESSEPPSYIHTYIPMKRKKIPYIVMIYISWLSN